MYYFNVMLACLALCGCAQKQQHTSVTSSIPHDPIKVHGMSLTYRDTRGNAFDEKMLETENIDKFYCYGARTLMHAMPRIVHPVGSGSHIVIQIQQLTFEKEKDIPQLTHNIGLVKPYFSQIIHKAHTHDVEATGYPSQINNDRYVAQMILLMTFPDESNRRHAQKTIELRSRFGTHTASLKDEKDARYIYSLAMEKILYDVRAQLAHFFKHDGKALAIKVLPFSLKPSLHTVESSDPDMDETNNENVSEENSESVNEDVPDLGSSHSNDDKAWSGESSFDEGGEDPETFDDL